MENVKSQAWWWGKGSVLPSALVKVKGILARNWENTLKIQVQDTNNVLPSLQRQIDPPKWRVTHFRNPHVNLDGRRFAVTRSLTPLCIGKIETPGRSTLLAGDDACAKIAGPAVVTPSIVLFDKTRCPLAGMVDLRYWMMLQYVNQVTLCLLYVSSSFFH